MAMSYLRLLLKKNFKKCDIKGLPAYRSLQQLTFTFKYFWMVLLQHGLSLNSYVATKLLFQPLPGHNFKVTLQSFVLCIKYYIAFRFRQMPLLAIASSQNKNNDYLDTWQCQGAPSALYILKTVTSVSVLGNNLYLHPLNLLLLLHLSVQFGLRLPRYPKPLCKRQRSLLLHPQLSLFE